MKAYIAAPFFNLEQIAVIDKIKEILTKHDIDYFSPKDEFICPPTADRATRKKTFEGNIDAILKSQIMVAVTDGKDMGTLFEAGVAYIAEIPIIYIAITLGDKPFNLMLAESSFSVCKSLEELDILLSGPFEQILYSGDIE